MVVSPALLRSDRGGRYTVDFFRSSILVWRNGNPAAPVFSAKWSRSDSLQTSRNEAFLVELFFAATSTRRGLRDVRSSQPTRETALPPSRPLRSFVVCSPVASVQSAARGHNEVALGSGHIGSATRSDSFLPLLQQSVNRPPERLSRPGGRVHEAAVLRSPHRSCRRCAS